MDRPQEVDPHSYRPPPAWGSLPTVEVCFHMGTCGGRPTLLTTRDYCSRDLSRQGFAMNLFVLRKLNLHQIPAVETAATKCTKPHLRGVPLGFEPAEAGFVNFVAVNLFARGCEFGTQFTSITSLYNSTCRIIPASWPIQFEE